MAEAAVEYSPQALKDLTELSPEVALRISTKVLQLGQDARPRGDTVRQLSGLSTPTFRLRIGDYRAIFRVGVGVVRIIRVTHRSRLERALRDLR